MKTLHKQPKAVLFDLDGTLLDTARDLGNALNHVLSENGLPLCSYEEYRDHASHGALGLIKLGFADKLEEFDQDLLRTRFLKYYESNICVDTCPFEGVNQLISELEEREIVWGIVTNKPGWLTDLLLPNFSSFASCAVVVSGDTLPQRKPDPAPLLFASKQINIPSDNIWYVGDAERDIQAAKSASMISIAADYGYIGEQGSIDWSPHLTIKHPLELVQYF